MPKIEVGPYIQIRGGTPTPISGYVAHRPGPRKKWSWTRVVVWLLLLYLLLYLCDDPRDASHQWGPFLAGVGHFFVRLVDTVGIFTAGLLGH